MLESLPALIAFAAIVLGVVAAAAKSLHGRRRRGRLLRSISCTMRTTKPGSSIFNRYSIQVRHLDAGDRGQHVQLHVGFGYRPFGIHADDLPRLADLLEKAVRSLDAPQAPR